MVRPCTSEGDYRDLLAASVERPVFLFKHSAT